MLARVQGWEWLLGCNCPCWRLGESNPSQHQRRREHSISASSLVPLSRIHAALAINAERAEVPVRASRGGAEGAAWVEEEEGGRKTFKNPHNCHQMGSCPRDGDVLAGGGAGEEKSKGRCEDFPAD